MSKKFTLPHRPLDWAATPKDLGGDNNLGLFVSETFQRYVYGTRFISWDGRVFKYAGVTTGGCVSYHGVASTAEAYLSYTANPVATAAGATSITATVASIAEDEVAGGFAVIYNSTIDNTVQRGIVGNDATSGSTTTFHLEGPLADATTTSFAHEIYANPYRLVSEATVTTASWMGVPTVTADSGDNVWIQSWGPCLLTPTNQTLDDAAANERMTFWQPNAGIAEVGDASVTAGENQVAGYILNAGTGGIAGPMIYLMCST